MKAEKELEGLYTDIEAASECGDGGAIATLSQKIHACKSEMETAFKQLESVNLKYERRKAPFDLRMTELDED